MSGEGLTTNNVSDMGTIRDALAAQIKAVIPELNTHAYEQDSPPDYPYLDIATTPTWNYMQVLGQGNAYTIDLVVNLLLQVGSTPEGWRTMDMHRCPTGTKSIKQAIWSDRTLGGKVDDITVVSSGRPTRNKSRDGALWEFACEFIVRIRRTP